MALRPSHCVFCLTNKVSKHGEHVWDDWLNRIDGKRIRRRYSFKETGPAGEVIRSYEKTSIDITWPVVCAACNNGWMSDITNESKKSLEVIIRQDGDVTILSTGIASLVALSFLKAVVIDYGGDRRPAPFFLPSTRQRVMRTRALPNGTVVWVARFVPGGGGHAWANYIQFRSSIYSGYEIYVCTYLIGHLVFQVMVPRWTKRTRKRPPLPPLAGANRFWSDVSFQVWPSVRHSLSWPPAFYLNSESIEVFKDRGRGTKVHPPTGGLLFPLGPVTPGQE